MTLKDVHNGPDWILWAAAVIFALISIVLLSGHGANLSAGYNTASEEKRINMTLRNSAAVSAEG